MAPPGTCVIVHNKPDNQTSWGHHGTLGSYFGPYDFNKYPMAPPGTRIIVHGKPGNRTSWVYHGTPGWYIGPSLDH